MFYIQFTWTSCYHGRDGTGFWLRRCWVIDRLVWWEVTYFEGHESAGIQDCVHLCVVLV